MRICILDRDGVINEDSKDFIKSAAEWIPISGSLEAIKNLNLAGIKVHIASNQSGVGRGLFDLAALTKIHDKMKAELSKIGAWVDGIHFCPHLPTANCHCRKPKSGLLEEILALYPEQDRKQVVMIGDALRDLDAALAAKCEAYLVLTGKGKLSQNTLSSKHDSVLIHSNLAMAVKHLLQC